MLTNSPSRSSFWNVICCNQANLDPGSERHVCKKAIDIIAPLILTGGSITLGTKIIGIAPFVGAVIAIESLTISYIFHKEIIKFDRVDTILKTVLAGTAATTITVGAGSGAVAFYLSLTSLNSVFETGLVPAKATLYRGNFIDKALITSARSSLWTGGFGVFLRSIKCAYRTNLIAVRELQEKGFLNTNPANLRRKTFTIVKDTLVAGLFSATTGILAARVITGTFSETLSEWTGFDISTIASIAFGATVLIYKND